MSVDWLVRMSVDWLVRMLVCTSGVKFAESLASFQNLLNNRIINTKTGFVMNNSAPLAEEDAVRALAALAQTTRLRLFRTLVVAGPAGRNAGNVYTALAIAPSALSFHLKELAHAGLILSRQEGRFMIYTARFELMTALLGFLTENCCQGFPGDGDGDGDGTCQPATNNACCPGTDSPQTPATSCC